jgi:hypothetical protein
MRRAMWAAVPMLRPVLLAALALSAACISLVPAASANHCAPYPLVQEASCEANHAVDPWVDFVFCFYHTAPSQWLRSCIVLTTEDGAAPLLP